MNPARAAFIGSALALCSLSLAAQQQQAPAGGGRGRIGGYDCLLAAAVEAGL
jgi:hypothetical protein